jgi:hypothetical protein
MTFEQERDIAAKATEGMRQLTRLVKALSFDPSPALREAIADLNASVALADRMRRRPTRPKSTA